MSNDKLTYFGGQTSLMSTCEIVESKREKKSVIRM